MSHSPARPTSPRALMLPALLLTCLVLTAFSNQPTALSANHAIELPRLFRPHATLDAANALAANLPEPRGTRHSPRAHYTAPAYVPQAPHRRGL